MTVDGGPHPNPRQAVEGYRLRVLDLDEPGVVEVARRIFTEYLERAGIGLSRTDSTATASPARPRDVRSRTGTGWQTAGKGARLIMVCP
jgi:hypothetical protein